jgi:hypothetical protein
MDIREIGWDAVHWKGPEVDPREHGNEPSGYIKGWRFLD